jgi:superfamily II DNA/RNA helicase
VHKLDTLLAVSTGGGKTLVYFLAALLLKGLKVAFVVLPTIELILNHRTTINEWLRKMGSLHKCVALGTAADDAKDEQRVGRSHFRIGTRSRCSFFMRFVQFC